MQLSKKNLDGTRSGTHSFRIEWRKSRMWRRFRWKRAIRLGWCSAITASWSATPDAEKWFGITPESVEAVRSARE